MPVTVSGLFHTQRLGPCLYAANFAKMVHIIFNVALSAELWSSARHGMHRMQDQTTLGKTFL